MDAAWGIIIIGAVSHQVKEGPAARSARPARTAMMICASRLPAWQSAKVAPSSVCAHLAYVYIRGPLNTPPTTTATKASSKLCQIVPACPWLCASLPPLPLRRLALGPLSPYSIRLGPFEPPGAQPPFRAVVVRARCCASFRACLGARLAGSRAPMSSLRSVKMSDDTAHSSDWDDASGSEQEDSYLDSEEDSGMHVEGGGVDEAGPSTSSGPAWTVLDTAAITRLQVGGLQPASAAAHRAHCVYGARVPCPAPRRRAARIGYAPLPLVQGKCVEEVVSILGCKQSVAKTVLRHFRWDTEALLSKPAACRA